MSEELDRQQALLEALQRPDCYPHPVERVEHVETHISHVLLAGRYAYKIKKPLDLGFLDFSTLARRRFFCEEELRLNRRLAPELYEAVVAFSGNPEAPRFDEGGEAFEYAVRMKRFDRDQELDKLLAGNLLPRQWMRELAETVSAFHENIPRAAPDSPLGSPEAVLQPMQENFDQLTSLLDDPGHRQQLERLREWTVSRHHSLLGVLQQRRREGFIRECHGDMHLGNMTRIDERLVIFDGIEFSEQLRWIDIISEVAFVTMDLEDRGSPGHARCFLNDWLEHTGDYEGLAVLRFYETYRAMVRAKVAGIRAAQDQSGSPDRQALTQCEQYLQMADRLTRPGRRALFINHGFSGSGKTTLSQSVLEAIGAVRIRSDVERKRLAGMSALERGDARVGAGLYSADMSARTYERLATLCEAALEAGLPVIADATFLQREQRDIFARLARRLGVPCVILDYRAPEKVLRERVQARAARDDQASDAGLAVLEHQLRNAEPPGDDERVIAIHHDQALPLEQIGRSLD